MKQASRVNDLKYFLKIWPQDGVWEATHHQEAICERRIQLVLFLIVFYSDNRGLPGYCFQAYLGADEYASSFSDWKSTKIKSRCHLRSLEVIWSYLNVIRFTKSDLELKHQMMNYRNVKICEDRNRFLLKYSSKLGYHYVARKSCCCWLKFSSLEYEFEDGRDVEVCCTIPIIELKFFMMS